MTIAEIRGKISETSINISERMEDLLTSNVFGNFRYLHPTKGLIPFLKTAVSLNDKGIDLPSSYKYIRYSFWPTLKIEGCNQCEPDIMIGLETDQGIYLVLIEVKYFSGLSSKKDENPNPNDQLACELDNLYTLNLGHIGWPTDLPVVSRSLLFITQDLKKPIGLLFNSLREYRSKRNKKGEIFWTSWRFLPNILENQLLTENNPEQKTVIEDMLSLLQRKGLTLFTGVHPILTVVKPKDFIFYKVSSQRYRWPILTKRMPIVYKFKFSSTVYRWETPSLLKLNFTYN